MTEHKRKVGERGQVTIPKHLRDRHGIDGGDEIVFVEEDGRIKIEPPTDPDRLAEGYRKRADAARKLTEEMEGVSSEATAALGDAPDWDEE